MKCLGNTKLSWTTLKTCFTGAEGTELFIHYGNVTASLIPKLTYVPHIIFNDVFDKNKEDDAREDFFKTACNLFTNNKPAVC